MTNRVATRLLGLLVMVLGVLSACATQTLRIDPSVPLLLRAESPTPLVAGSVIKIHGYALYPLEPDARLVVSTPSVRVELPVLEETRQDKRVFVFTESAVSALGVGTHNCTMVIEDRNHGQSDALSRQLEIATSLPLNLTDPPSGYVRFGEQVVLHGEGFLTPEEGETLGRFEGTFVSPESGLRTISTTLPITLAEATDRSRALMILGTALGGPEPGTFRGQFHIEATAKFGDTQVTPNSEISLTFERLIIFGVEPSEGSLEERILVLGGGFLSDVHETTLLRFNGRFDEPGGTFTNISNADLVPEWQSGESVVWTLSSLARGGRLVSDLFGASRGRFVGTLTPIAISGRSVVLGTSVPVDFRLKPTRQVVLLSVLPGFYDTIRLYGLSAASPVVIENILARIAEIYEDYGVEVTTTRPSNVSENGYTIVELGGPDPSGFARAGFDNTPGKDVGNVRLYDTLGGVNTSSGRPSYGGVFAESLLYFSSHPELGGDLPDEAPIPDPLFDEIFDPVRRYPPTTSEVAGEATQQRLEQIDRAVTALGNMVGETVSHELGHALGLAQPYGALDAYHNPTSEAGCIMRAGGFRPFAERVSEPGSAKPHFCDDEVLYLEEILGRDE